MTSPLLALAVLAAGCTVAARAIWLMIIQCSRIYGHRVACAACGYPKTNNTGEMCVECGLDSRKIKKKIILSGIYNSAVLIFSFAVISSAFFASRRGGKLLDFIPNYAIAAYDCFENNKTNTAADELYARFFTRPYVERPDALTFFLMTKSVQSRLCAIASAPPASECDEKDRILWMIIKEMPQIGYLSKKQILLVLQSRDEYAKADCIWIVGDIGMIADTDVRISIEKISECDTDSIATIAAMDVLFASKQGPK